MFVDDRVVCYRLDIAFIGHSPFCRRLASCNHDDSVVAAANMARARSGSWRSRCKEPDSEEDSATEAPQSFLTSNHGSNAVPN
eukprot:2505117-Amphidinium_carterae.1